MNILSSSVCLSVRHMPVVYTKTDKHNIGSSKQRPTIAQGLYSFLTPKISVKSQQRRQIEMWRVQMGDY